MKHTGKPFRSLVPDSAGGLVFGIPLSQCLENDRIARIASGEVSDVGCLSRSSRHGSRTSFTSLIEPTVAAKTEEVSRSILTPVRPTLEKLSYCQPDAQSRRMTMTEGFIF